jgi:tetratricopeptide (TPR) repeat protein
MTKVFAASLACLLAALWVPQTGGQGSDEPEDIFTRASKDKYAYRGFIIAESPRSIRLKGKKDDIPADQIEDIVFPVLPLAEVRLKLYRPAMTAEKLANTTKKEGERPKALAEALAKYEEALPLLKEGQPRAQAHIEYKIANLLYVQAREGLDKAALTKAAAKLKEFAGKHDKAWQLARVLKMLAEAQFDLEQYAEAEQTYQQLARADVPDPVRQDAEVQALLVTMRAGKYDAAADKLRGLISKLPKGTEKLRAQLALGECLAMGKKVPEAKKELKAVLDETKDKLLRGQAYNTMGLCYWLNEQWQDARWEFLWVDTIYNQDKNQHAKALYYLQDIFARLGDGDRARECRQALRSEQFAGTEFQQRLSQEEKSKEGSK